MAMTFEQYKELRKKGYSQEQLQKLNTENKPKGFFQKLGASLSKRKSNITNEAQNFASGSITKPEYYLRGTGQVAGAFGDVVGQAVGAAGRFAFKNFLTPETQGALKTAGTKALQSKPGQLAMGGLQAGADKYGRFAEANPRLATNLAAVGNIATAVPIGKGVGMAGREVVDTAIDVGNITKRIGTPNVDRVIETGVMKGIKPSVVGKNTLNQVGRYKDQAKQAVLNIVKNKKNLTYTDEFGEVTGGRVPESLKEASEAIDQTKRSIFKEYDALTKKAGSAGSIIDLNGVANELKTIVDDPVMRTVSPQSVSYAEKMMENLSKQGTFTPEQAQKAIENLNESLQTFYKNPSFNSYSNVQIDALIANQLRKSLDEVVTGATGKEYQELKNAYASLKAIEKDVLKRAVVEGRKNAKGLIDFTDIFSAGDIIAGVTTMNPALIAKGGIQKAVASYFKGLNSPDKAIKKMFKGVEKSIEKGKEKFVPKSKMFKMIEKTKGKPVGMSIQDISRSGIEVSEKQWEKLNNSAFIEALNDYGKKLEQTLNKEKRSPKINLDKIDKLEDAFDDVKAAKKTKGALSPEAAKLWSARFKKLGIDFDEYYSLPQAMGMQKNTFTKGERGRFTGSKSMKSTDPLLQEARKYKSAEEFVRAVTEDRGGIGAGVEYSPWKRRIETEINDTPLTKFGFNPDEKVTIYRGVDRASQNKIQDGDYIALSHDLAKSYTGGMVISEKVPASSIRLSSGDGLTAADFKDRNNLHIEAVYNPNEPIKSSQLTDLWKKATKKKGR